MFSTLLVLTTLLNVLQACEPNCASCRNLSLTDYYCLACSPGNELVSVYSICIQDTTINNCAHYMQTLDCKYCRPSYAKSSNVCNKMYDGCLIQQNKECYLCLQGSFLSNQTGTCVVKYLNCINISQDGACVQCYPEYMLQNGKCFYNNTNCTNANQDTGLCSECSSKNFLLGYSCVSQNETKTTDNCYLIKKGTNITCKYCKTGYGLYFGICMSFRDLIAKLQIQDLNCSKTQYINDNQIQCFNLSVNSTLSVNNCLILDFGFKKCMVCQPFYSLNSKGSCSSIFLNFCLKFGASSLCTQCKNKFYLKDGKCYPFPNFCAQYSSSCIRCEDDFQLINGRCVDPSCQVVNNITGVCQICLINYQLNAQNICKYIDANCKKTGKIGDCVECQNGFTLKSNGLCAYQDVNCLTMNQIQKVCILCKPQYYLNTQAQVCIPLPNNCLVADVSGKCTQCLMSYTLTSAYQCLFILQKVAKCKIVNKSNFSKCSYCIDGFFADNNGVCQILPFFCTQFDPNTNTCVQCNPNGVMKSGVCVDKNCQIFDAEGSCLACLQSYVFGNFGQCILQIKDLNCKIYQYNICKMCSQRYYFNFQFNCVPVSPFCNTYDSNSGVCTSCYSGYQLSQTGDCSMTMFNSIIYSDDMLSDYCKKTNRQGQCIECYSNYNPIPISVVIENASIQVLNCVQKITGNNYCLQSDKNDVCIQCVTRMYLEQNGNCKSIDPNCDKYNNTNGACISCYYGFNVSYDNSSKTTTCVIINSKDPYCQNKSSSGCQKCYQGYFYSNENLICQQVDPQCATFNQSNGNCLTCYNGYQLKQMKCVVRQTKATITHSSLDPNINTDKSDALKNNGTNVTINFNTSTSAINQSLKETNCINMDLQRNICMKCQWGYALINGSCFQQDPHCKTFLNPNSLKCLECYNGYKTFSSSQNLCVQEALLVNHCLKYDQFLNCILCDHGYVLSAGKPNFICSVIDKNCLLYNTTLNMCQKCIFGAVLQGRVCVLALYGIDPNCSLYKGGICVKCKENWILEGFLCSQK